MRQKEEIPVPMATGPLRQRGITMLGMLQRARREGLQDTKPGLCGIARWDPDLSREQAKILEEKDRPMWRLIQSGQYHTAVRAAKLGIAEDDTCFLCGQAKQSWTHLWSACPGLAAARRGFGPYRPRTPAGRDLRTLCGKVLADPERLPPAMAQYGIALEMGADLTMHWWAHTGNTVDQELNCVEAGAWPAEMHPELASIVPFLGGSVRQTVEAALGPTQRFPDLDGPLCEGIPGWGPGYSLMDP